MPIILQSALVSNLYFISQVKLYCLHKGVGNLSFFSVVLMFLCGMQLLYRSYSGNFLINLLGKWKESEYSGGQSIPVGGLAYYVTAPSRFVEPPNCS